MKKFNLYLLYSDACERAKNIGGFFFITTLPLIMTTLRLARKEFNKISPLLKPLICKDPNTKLYFVSIVFSKQYCISKGFKVIK